MIVEAPLEKSFARAKEFVTPLFVNDVEVGATGQQLLQCNLTFAPVLQSPGHVLVLIAPRELAGRVNQTNSVMLQFIKMQSTIMILITKTVM